MKQIQQEQVPLKYNQTIPWDKTQTEVGIHYHECQRKLNNCKILRRSTNKRTVSHFWQKTAWNINMKKYRKWTVEDQTSKFLDDNKPKLSLKKWIRTVSNFIGLIQFHLICQNVCEIFWGWISKLEKGKENFCVLYSIKRSRETRKFHVAVLQRRLRDVQKSVMHVQSCCFANINLLLCGRPRCRQRRRCLSSEILLPWKRDDTLLFSIVYKPSCSSPVPSGAAEASPSVVPIPSSNLTALPVWGSRPFSGFSPPVEWEMNKFRKTLESMLKINLPLY